MCYKPGHRTMSVMKGSERNMIARTRADRLTMLLLMLPVLIVVPTLSVAEDTPDAEVPAASTAPEAPAGPAVPPSTPLDQMSLRLSPLTEADLAAEADAWLALAKAETQKVVDARLRLGRASEAETAAAGEAVMAVRAERREIFERFSAVLSAWEGKGGDPAKIATYRQYMSAVAKRGSSRPRSRPSGPWPRGGSLPVTAASAGPSGSCSS